MALFPMRGLSKFGVISDVDPYNLPSGAWSFAVNARFHNGSIYRAPVYRTVTSSLAYDNPRFVSSNSPTTGFDNIIIGYLNGRVTSYKSGTETDISLAAYVNANAESPFTSCHLGDVLYVNRDDRVPWALRTSDAAFLVLANWTSTWRARLLRSCGGALCAFNITKAGVAFPTMIKTSEFALSGAVPTTWDSTAGTNNATENILAEMEGPITDAQNLGEIMIVYGLQETWTMIADGSTNIWSYHKLPFDLGAIAANCAVQVSNKHYVFGLTDLWVHDGVSKKSICDQRTREFIFSSINISQARRCFVSHNQSLKQIHFNYVSGDRGVAFAPGTGGCNRAAVYSYEEDVWTYYDLPYVFGAARANLDISVTYATWPGTYDTIGGSYLDMEDSLKKAFVMVGEASSTYSLSQSLYAFDLQGPGSAVGFTVDTHATRPVTLERDGIDLDEIGVDLVGYKVINTIYPQARLEAGAQPLSFQFGSADYFGTDATLSDPQTYDGAALYKLDFNDAGRYLTMKMTHNDYHYFCLTGFDVDLDVLGES